jgi:hypothetical protein
MKCRNAPDDVKTGGGSVSRDKLGSEPEGWPGGIRHIGGAKSDQALMRNVRTCRPDAKGDVQAAKTVRSLQIATLSTAEPTLFQHQCLLREHTVAAAEAFFVNQTHVIDVICADASLRNTPSANSSTSIA